MIPPNYSRWCGNTIYDIYYYYIRVYISISQYYDVGISLYRLGEEIRYKCKPSPPPIRPTMRYHRHPHYRSIYNIPRLVYLEHKFLNCTKVQQIFGYLENPVIYSSRNHRVIVYLFLNNLISKKYVTNEQISIYFVFFFQLM